MKDSLLTEEYKKKKSFKTPILILIALIIIALIVFAIYTYISSKNKALEEKKKQETEPTTLNTELQNIYGFAITDNYITALKNDGTIFKIYNLLQGTGNLGDFTYYTYFNDKLYLIFSDNNIYTISLREGDGVYELKKDLYLDNITCGNGTTGKTSDLAFYGNTIYFNTSNCGVSRLSYNKTTKKAELTTLKTFNNQGVNIEFSNTTKSLYAKADNNIYMFNNQTGQIEIIATNAGNEYPLTLKNNILLYLNNNNNTFYGYNIKTNTSGSIANNISNMIIYKTSFIYYTNDTIYMLTGSKTKTIYQVHYNSLSNMQLIGENTLQIIDSDTTDDTKKRIINIDLSTSKLTTSINEHEFTNIVEYTK